jgi:hypothetical protein
MRLIAAALLGLAVLASAPAGAQFWGARPQGPWCAVYQGAFHDTRWDCFYPTLEACVPFILGGTRGFCQPNPHYPGPVAQSHRHRRKH